MNNTFTQTDAVLEDFVFGGIEADETRLLTDLRHRAAGIRHFYTISPLDPQPGQPVTITVYVGADVHLDQMTVYITTDGSEPAGRRGKAAAGFSLFLKQVEVRWHEVIWDYIAIWQGEIPAQPAGTLVQYRIEGWRAADETFSCWSSEPNMDSTVEQPTRYGYTVDSLTPPSWSHAAILYHVFVDRFAIPATDSAHRWLDPAEMNNFMGGNLRGIIERFDYIVDLGVNTLWLSPIFVTPTYHGYDTTDYYQVDPRFGTKDDLHDLVQQAHQRGLRVLLDFVANHTSIEFAPFVEAQKNSDSPYRAWFSFGDTYKQGYRAFFDVASMPQLNTDAPAVRNFLIDAACYWLREYDIDGYRLDYAAGPSHAFWSEFRAACKRVKPDCWLFGEVTQAGNNLRTYTGQLDGCLDFAFCRLVRQMCSKTQPQLSISQFANALERSHRFFDEPHINTDEHRFNQNRQAANLATPNFVRPAFLDNHDMNRFLWVAGNDKTRLRLAAGLLFALGGPPIIYYGAEVGLSQPRTKGPWREEARHFMPWGEDQDQALLANFKTWIALRRQHPALQVGSLITRYINDAQQVWLVERAAGNDRLLIAANVSAHPHYVSLPQGKWRLSGQSSVIKGLKLPANSVIIFLAT